MLPSATSDGSCPSWAGRGFQDSSTSRSCEGANVYSISPQEQASSRGSRHGEWPPVGPSPASISTRACSRSPDVSRCRQVTIDWHQGSALGLPFHDGVFDVVLCQQGFQFFPDRPKALHEMRRVLSPVGRVALSVWTGPSPYFVALREALSRHVSSEAAASGVVAFSLGDANELRALLERAGFRDVVVHH